MEKNFLENFFLELNLDFLSNLKKGNFKNTEFKYKPIFIMAFPRGGSTFLQQILISSTNIGYISNLVALFWDYPELGAALQKKFFKDTFISTFDSKFGNTQGIFEPHEWGFFWRKWLNIKANTKCSNSKKPSRWKKFKSELVHLEEILEMPLIFDTPYANKYMKKINLFLNKPKIIFLFRSPHHVCNSIFRARLKKFKTLNKFYAEKPRNSKIEKINNPIEEVVAQVWYIFQDMIQTMEKLNKESFIRVKYEDFFLNFDATLKEIIKFTTNDFSIVEKSKKFPKFGNRNEIDFFDKSYKEEFDFFFKKYFKSFNYDKF